MYDATRVFTGVATRVSWQTDCTWQRVATNLDQEKKTFSTFERSIIGSVKTTTDLDPPRLSASNPIFFFQKS
jgi:hypothetical protein